MLKRSLLTSFVVPLTIVQFVAGCGSNSERHIEQRRDVMSSGEPVHASDSSFQSQVLESKQPVLVDFWAARCTPCLKMKPAIRQLVKDFRGQATIVELDVDANPLVSQRYDIRQLPIVLIFRNGEVVRRLSKLRTKEELTIALRDALTLPAT